MKNINSNLIASKFKNKRRTRGFIHQGISVLTDVISLPGKREQAKRHLGIFFAEAKTYRLLQTRKCQPKEHFQILAFNITITLFHCKFTDTFGLADYIKLNYITINYVKNLATSYINSVFLQASKCFGIEEKHSKNF